MTLKEYPTDFINPKPLAITTSIALLGIIISVRASWEFYSEPIMLGYGLAIGTIYFRMVHIYALNQLPSAHLVPSAPFIH